MEPQTIVVQPDGMMKFIYEDDLAELLKLGVSKVRRAGHVEPNTDGGTGVRWWVDLDPVRRGLLGSFARREAALAAERAAVTEMLIQGAI
jgi:hypothetical protein